METATHATGLKKKMACCTCDNYTSYTAIGQSRA